MTGACEEQSPGKKDPHVNSTLLLALGTIFFALGSILCYIGDDLLTGFLPPFIGSMIFYLGGLMLYLMNSHKPSYVGYVVNTTEKQMIFVYPQQFQDLANQNTQHSSKDLIPDSKSALCGEGAVTVLPQ